MSCLSFEIGAINNADFSADAKNDLEFASAVKNDMVFSFSNRNELKTEHSIQNNLTFTVGLVCSVSIGGTPAGYEVLWALDGILFTVDNGYLYVRK